MTRQAGFCFVAAFVLSLVASRDADAQAWVGEKGSLDLSLDYNFAKSDKVLGDASLEFPDAGTTTHQFTLGAEYVPIPHLAVAVGLPLALFEYTGSKTLYPHPGGGTYDDGSIHTTLTDLRAGAHYQLLEDPVALAPLVAVSFPVAQYETVGNTVGGRHLTALHLGLAVGRLITDELYAHVQYEFSIVQKFDRTPDTALIGQNTSDASLAVGYKFLENRLDINIGGNLHVTHGGVDFSNFAKLPSTQQLYHDPLLRENMILLGGGIGYQVSNSFSVSLAAKFFVSGVNTQNANVFALGLTWSPLH